MKKREGVYKLLHRNKYESFRDVTVKNHHCLSSSQRHNDAANDPGVSSVFAAVVLRSTLTFNIKASLSVGKKKKKRSALRNATDHPFT